MAAGRAVAPNGAHGLCIEVEIGADQDPMQLLIDDSREIVTVDVGMPPANVPAAVRATQAAHACRFAHRQFRRKQRNEVANPNATWAVNDLAEINPSKVEPESRLAESGLIGMPCLQRAVQCNWAGRSSDKCADGAH